MALRLAAPSQLQRAGVSEIRTAVSCILLIQYFGRFRRCPYISMDEWYIPRRTDSFKVPGRLRPADTHLCPPACRQVVRGCHPNAEDAELRPRLSPRPNPSAPARSPFCWRSTPRLKSASASTELVCPAVRGNRSVDVSTCMEKLPSPHAPPANSLRPPVGTPPRRQRHRRNPPAEWRDCTRRAARRVLPHGDRRPPLPRGRHAV